MIYPPPPGNAWLAYQFGKITKDELMHMLKLWYEKHPEPTKEEKAE